MSSEELRQTLGQCFFVGFDGVELTPTIESFIRDNKIGGVTLFANNYESPGQVAELINSIQALRGSAPPLAICVDHEGGKVQRFRKHFSRFPEARLIAEHGSPKLVFECAEIMAQELRAVGVNVNFSPVADINTNPNNPVIGARAYGATEEEVSKMVTACVRGHLTHGVQCVVKHFPGHGDTSKDSHFHLPKIQTSLETLLERELKPFMKAFKSRCEIVMTAHIIVESIDKSVPATMSSKVIQGLLREQLRFRGLIISDDMEMKAIADHFSQAEAGTRALAAGVNILLYHTEPFEIPAFEAIVSALSQPGATEAKARLVESAKAVTAFRAKHFTGYKPVIIPEVSEVVGSKKHQDFIKHLEKQVGAATA